MEKEIQRRLLKGIPASPGIIIGRAYVFQDILLRVERCSLGKEYADEEGSRLKQAIHQVIDELIEDNFQVSHRIGKREAEIFLAHVAIFEDPYFIAQILRHYQIHLRRGRFMKHVRLSLGVLALMLILLGCAKPPDTEREAAKAAMDAAVSVGADKYASADLDAATKVWDTAESQMKEKKYKEAKQSYIDAKTAFEKASAAVDAGKKAAADQANASLSAIEESWKSLEVTAGKMAKRMKEKKEEWTADAGALIEGLAKAKEMIATDPTGAKAKLDELKGIVDKWESTFKKMASAPKESKTVKKKSVKKKGAKKVVAKKKAVKNKTVKKNGSQKTKE